MGMLLIVKALLTAYVLGNTFIVPRTAITSNVFQVLENLSLSKCLNHFLKIIMNKIKKTSSFQNRDNDD